MRKKMKNKFFRNAILFLAGTLLFSCGGNTTVENAEAEGPANQDIVLISSEQFDASGMKLGGLEQQPFARSIKANGYIDVPPERKASVSVKLGGFVRNLTILPGDKVAQGAVLFSLENPDFIQLQQDYLEARAQLRYLESDYERQKTLASENIASQKNFLKAESDFHVMQAKYQGLKEKLKLLNIDTRRLEDGIIASTVSVFAPLGGYVSKVNITRGVFVSPADVAVEIVNTEHLHVELQVFEKDMAVIRKGQPLTFNIPGSGAIGYKGEIYLIGKTIDNDTRTVNVHGHIKDESIIQNLLPGMYVEATIDVANDLRMVLPSEAVVSVGDKHFVLVRSARDDSGYTFTRKEVSIGVFNNQWTEILNAPDFKANEVVLIKGAFNLVVE